MLARQKISLSLLLVIVFSLGHAQTALVERYGAVADSIVAMALRSNKSIELLTDLVTTTGHRFSGTEGAAKGVEWSRRTMTALGFDSVRLETVMVPRWVRGPVEEVTVRASKGRSAISLSVAALGGSIGTPQEGITAEVLEVKSFDELRALGGKAKGKIIFFNRPMDRGFVNTFRAYGEAVNQRGSGAIEAAKAGGVAALVRSMTTSINDFPHTGGMGYADSVRKVPAISVSTQDAEMLSALLNREGSVTATIRMSAATLPDVESANVIGELRGSEHPEEIIVIGGHLDSWDKGVGAQDDGAGCVQSIEALRILKALGLKPKRTIRAVMFMNEENGLRGGIAYAAKKRPGERHLVAIESDMGGFSPRGFGISDSLTYAVISTWAKVFEPIGAERIERGGGGADISPLMRAGIPGIGLLVDTQRYFDLHHTDQDILANVNERELALGSAALAILSYVISEEGLPQAQPVRDTLNGKEH